MKRTYLDTDVGQLHARFLDSESDDRGAPLVCLHPAPYSGNYYKTAMPLLNDGRQVWAPDYPGYGGSTGPSSPPRIEDYAAAIAGALGRRLPQPVDLLGFHSGCLVACELALQQPDWVRSLVLIDVPYFDRDTRKKLLKDVAQPLALTHELGSLSKAFDFNVAARRDQVPLDRGLEMFVDQLRSGTRDHYCFHAAFSYDAVERFAKVDRPTTVIATTSPLTEATRSAADAIRGSMLVELPQVKGAVFEVGAERIARAVVDALDRG